MTPLQVNGRNVTLLRGMVAFMRTFLNSSECGYFLLFAETEYFSVSTRSRQAYGKTITLRTANAQQQTKLTDILQLQKIK